LQAHLGEELAAACRQTLSGILWSYMSEAIEDGNWPTARKLYWQSLREYPRGVLQGRVKNTGAAWLRIRFPALYKSLRGKAAGVSA
jgi:hypothetical protein